MKHGQKILLIYLQVSGVGFTEIAKLLINIIMKFPNIIGMTEKSIIRIAYTYVRLI